MIKIIDWCKKNWKYVILIFTILLLLAWARLRENKITRITKQLTELRINNVGLNIDRENLELNIKLLQSQYHQVEYSNDSMKIILLQLQSDLITLKAKNHQIIDSLKNIPPDSVFKRLQGIYPNYGQLPLQYPFSSSQIKPMYSTVISYGLLNNEYTLQGKSLNTCLNLNSGYESGIKILNSQIANLQENVNKADSQIKNYNKTVAILNRQVKNKSFWTRILILTSLISTGIAIAR